MNDHSFTRTGTVGGTLTIILANITSQDAVKTIALAGLGATVSFFVSYILKRMMRKRK